ncbi:MotA/TolQ/ExbB proton channel family protein [bacterium]|nr:MotA/TolQ/ExbB proton channel family protein [bacterium]
MSFNVILDALYVSGPVAAFVFIVLIIMSILSWGLIIATAIYFKRLANLDEKFLQEFEKSSKPIDLYKDGIASDLNSEKLSGVRAIFSGIYKEVVHVEQRVKGLNFVDPKMQNLKSNFDEVIQRTIEKVTSKENNKRERYFSFFATTSNVAPFIGLLGTVIGIIDAFAEIGRIGSADLGFVAPAISEALVATALGLFVAIPASIAFNYFKAKSFRFKETFDHFALDLLNHIQQQYFIFDHTTEVSAAERVG